MDASNGSTSGILQAAVLTRNPRDVDVCRSVIGATGGGVIIGGGEKNLIFNRNTKMTNMIRRTDSRLILPLGSISSDLE